MENGEEENEAKLIVRCECLDVHKSMQLTFYYNPQANEQQDDAAEIDDD